MKRHDIDVRARVTGLQLLHYGVVKSHEDDRFPAGNALQAPQQRGGLTTTGHGVDVDIVVGSSYFIVYGLLINGRLEGHDDLVLRFGYWVNRESMSSKSI